MVYLQRINIHGLTNQIYKYRYRMLLELKSDLNTMYSSHLSHRH